MKTEEVFNKKEYWQKRLENSLNEMSEEEYSILIEDLGEAKKLVKVLSDVKSGVEVVIPSNPLFPDLTGTNKYLF